MHFYTISATERDSATPGLRYRPDGIACYVFDSQVAGTTPLYRLYRSQNDAHFYTISADERDHAIAHDGFQSEGSACYVFGSQAAGTTPLYRLFSPGGLGALASMKLSNIHFDLDHAVMGAPQVVGESVQDITNTTTVQQQNTFTFEIDYSETQKWSATFGIKVGVQASINSGIPIISEGKIQISTEISFSYTWGTEHTTTRKYTSAIPVNVPPNSHVIARAAASTAQVSVPYSADAVYHFTGGQDIQANVTGVVEGATAYLMQVSFTSPQPMS